MRRWVWVLLLLPGLASADPATSVFLGGSMDVTCGDGEVRVRPISRRHVRAFRASRITPRLEGYTWRQAVGGWQGVEEPSYELLVYGGDAREVARVGREWEACFCQQSVLVVTSEVTLGVSSSSSSSSSSEGEAWRPGAAPALVCPSGVVLPEME